MKAPSTLLLLLISATTTTTTVVVNATEDPVKNSPRCSEKQDPASELSCRKARAGGLTCDDRTKCRDINDLTERQAHPPFRSDRPEDEQRFIPIYSCSDDDAARRIGMTCNSFPYYNGGYPILAGGIDWDEEWETYTCTISNGTTCMEWESREDSLGEYEVGVYTCDALAETELGFSYCQTWTSSQQETKKCSSGSVGEPNNHQTAYYRKRCCDDSSCWDCSYHPHAELEYSTATCDKVNGYGACLEWSEEEYDQYNLHFREYANYTCLEVSENQEYCRRWFGSVDSEEEFEMASCTCLDEDSQDQHYCSKWMCYEQGLSYHFPNYVWTLLPILVICTWACYCTCCGSEEDFSEEDRAFCSSCGSLCLFVPLSIALAHLSGFAAVLIATGILLCLCGVANRCRRRLDQPPTQAITFTKSNDGEASSAVKTQPQANPENVDDILVPSFSAHLSANFAAQ